MSELQQAMRVLVDRPPTAPAPIETIAARGARFARRRHLVRGTVSLAVVGAIASAAGLAVAFHGSSPGQVVLSTGGPVSAGYIAEQPGGYVATGTWQLTITRGSEVIELRSPSSQSCGQTGIIQPGDEVRGSITGPHSSLRAGERFRCPS
jgi:hypothetical protein